MITNHNYVDTTVLSKEEPSRNLSDESQWTYVGSKRWYSDC